MSAPTTSRQVATITPRFQYLAAPLGGFAGVLPRTVCRAAVLPAADGELVVPAAVAAAGRLAGVGRTLGGLIPVCGGSLNNLACRGKAADSASRFWERLS